MDRFNQLAYTNGRKKEILLVYSWNLETAFLLHKNKYGYNVGTEDVELNNERSERQSQSKAKKEKKEFKEAKK